MARHRSLICVASVLAVLCGLSACTADNLLPAASTTAAIDGLRSAPDHRSLVANYTGGACDGPAHLRTVETGDRIDLTVVIQPDPTGAHVCSSVGVGRTVTAELTAPIGKRVIWNDQHRVVPFDGARLLTPTWLPDGFRPGYQDGGSETANPSSTDPLVTTTWTTTFAEPATAATTGRCEPSRGRLAVTVGSAQVAKPGSDWTKVESATVGTAPAVAYREGSASTPTGRALVWTSNQGPIQITTDQSCEGDDILSFAELLRVARSLRHA